VILLAKTTFSFCELFGPFLSPFWPFLRVLGSFLIKHAQNNEKIYYKHKNIVKVLKTLLNFDQEPQVFVKFEPK